MDFKETFELDLRHFWHPVHADEGLRKNFRLWLSNQPLEALKD
jgi:hypothetical protein